MTPRPRTTLAVLVTALLALLLAVPLSVGTATAAPKAKAKPGKDRPVTVMTRNIYLGADIFRPLKAAEEAAEEAAEQELPSAEAAAAILHAVATANHETKEIVHQTNFPVRARLLAREIKRTKPDLVGLQEVALWRTGPLEMDKLGVPNATTVDQDFLAILRKELRKRGLKYKVVVVGTRADVEAPAWAADRSDQRDERLTMHDVILAKRGVKVLRKGDRIFTNNLPVALAGIKMNFDRGYQWADVKVRGKKFRFVNTHLESASSDIAYGQAAEVVEKVVKKNRTTVMVCDCNSDPLNKKIKPNDTVPHKMAYDYLTGAGGFTDQWLEWRPARKGWTSGLSELVNDPNARTIDHRIDLVLARTRTGEPLKVRKGWITGAKKKERHRATGLWPSDHAGVVLKLKDLPRR